MKAELYGIRGSDGIWQWRFTLDYETDREMGIALLEARVGIIRFRPELSLGQAVYIAGKLRIRCQRNAKPKEVWREFMIACREAGISRERLAQIRMLSSPFHNQASTSSRAPLNYRMLDHMIRILAGRSLLPEEFMSLLEDAGFGEWKTDWRRYVQAGACMGALRLDAGMEWISQKSWPAGILHTVQCRRCGTAGSIRVQAPFGTIRGLERIGRQLGFGGGSGKQSRGPGIGLQDGFKEERGVNWTYCKDCGGICAYCEECLTMGRIRQCSVLIRGLGEHDGKAGNLHAGPVSITEVDWSRWGLSPAQKAAAEAGVRFLEEPQAPSPSRFLIWAVTGAGKTEMIFPLIDYELAHNRQILIATPRRDVVLELAPRLAKAFPERMVVSLYGGSEDRWKKGEVTLSTTHQLMRFYQAFDLVIIDELDAYPYHNNPMLIHAAREVCKPGGRYIFLSATPPASMQKEVSRGILPCVRVPVRYHRHPLPVPKRVAVPHVDRMLRHRSLPRKLQTALKESLGRGAQVFVFVPRIAWVEPLVRLLGEVFPEAAVRGTSSKDELRREKVQDFRDRKFALLVTTTILERGVTVPMSDVFILGADAALFDEASLVQMAGRAGRSKDDPDGRVIFASREWTASQLRAIRQIREMNRLAQKKGFLLKSSTKEEVKE